MPDKVTLNYANKMITKLVSTFRFHGNVGRYGRQKYKYKIFIVNIRSGYYCVGSNSQSNTELDWDFVIKVISVRDNVSINYLLYDFADYFA